MPQDFWSNAIYSVTPTILVGLIFWFVIRAILRADSTERKARARIEAEERAKLGMPVAPVVATPAPVSANARDSETARASANSPAEPTV